MDIGKIILLNGTSSSGKSTTARELHGLLDEPYLYADVDTFLGMLPSGYFGANPKGFKWVKHKEKDMEGVHLEVGKIGHSLISGMHRSIAALASAGNNVIFCHVFQEKEWLKECVELFSDYQVLFVGIRCSLEVAEKRERKRMNRVIGQTRVTFDIVHSHKLYDIEVNTTSAEPQECALQIKTFLQTSNGKPAVFKKLLNKLNKS